MHIVFVFALALSSVWASIIINQNEAEEDYSFFYDDFMFSTEYIAGGIEVPVTSHPHMAALTQGNRLRVVFCGGSIITTRTILTAAHCITHVYIDGTTSSSLRAVVGTSYWNSGGLSYSIRNDMPHPRFNARTLKNDIGVLITTSEITMADLVRPIKLDYVFADGGIPVKVAGWGKTGPDSSASESLQELNLTTVNSEQCSAGVTKAGQEIGRRPLPVMSEIEICASHEVGGVCRGDSGSALVRVDNGQQIGVMSWTFPCGYTAPHMFARISAYREWLSFAII